MALIDRLKKIDGLVVRSFVGPYLLSFFIAQFVLVMQFLWKYIDDILGKGFSVIDLLELITYFGVTQISMALPIAILLSSVMVFGNMSERYELSSMKSAGVSLIRVMRPAIILAVLTAILSLFASNYLKPQANFQFQKRLRIMKSQKPSLAMEAKIFNRDFGGYSIRVNEKTEDEDITDVLIYDHTNNDKSLVNLTKAEKGKMYNSEDGNLFIMELENGTSYREMKRERRKDGKGKKYPFMRTDFKEWKKVFDMSEFDTDDEDGISINRNKEDMLNTFQLLSAIDSVDQKKAKLVASVVNEQDEKMKMMEEDYSSSKAKYGGKEGAKRLELERAKAQKKKAQKSIPKKNSIVRKTISQESKPKVNRKDRTERRIQATSAKKVKQASTIKKMIDAQTIMPKKTIRQALQKTVMQNQVDTLSNYAHWYETISDSDKNSLPVKAVQSSSRRKDLLRNATTNIKSLSYTRNKYLLRLNQQYSFALICIVFLFIGAPLGSIIRKGGYGYPLLFAILFYMLFIISTIMGEKLVRSGSMNPIIAAWFSNMLVLPVAVWLSIKALRDSKFESNRVFTFIGNLFTKSQEEKVTNSAT
jgi:lipopolysaccharide export system permease protein